ncbi:hypothetical protein [Paraburkholderia sp.]|uniref:hypothetical protein n=1 Tax=Paraburkholderia sp. TaxID=1926495 RepID=UPI0025F5E7E1|nr:hypothetical protein [Paraburkholderia sp.]
MLKQQRAAALATLKFIVSSPRLSEFEAPLADFNQIRLREMDRLVSERIPVTFRTCCRVTGAMTRAVAIQINLI